MALYESFATTSTADSQYALYITRQVGQTWTATDDHTITAVNFWGWRSPTVTGNFSIWITSVTNSSPDTSIVYGSGAAVVSTAFVTTIAWQTIEMDTFATVSNGTLYGIVCMCTTAISATIAVNVRHDATSAIYSSGKYSQRASNTVGWTLLATYDAFFRIYGSAIAAGSIVGFATIISGESSVSTDMREFLTLVTSIEGVSLTTTDLRLIIGYYTAIYGIGSLATTLELVTAAIVALATSIYATAEVSAALKKLAYSLHILSASQVNPLFAADSFDSFLVGGDTEIQDNAYAPLIEALLRFSLGSSSGIDRVLTGSAGTVVTIKGGIVVGLS